MCGSQQTLYSDKLFLFSVLQLKRPPRPSGRAFWFPTILGVSGYLSDIAGTGSRRSILYVPIGYGGQAERNSCEVQMKTFRLPTHYIREYMVNEK